MTNRKQIILRDIDLKGLGKIIDAHLDWDKDDPRDFRFLQVRKYANWTMQVVQ